jgi:hypothetical protein
MCARQNGRQWGKSIMEIICWLISDNGIRFCFIRRLKCAYQNVRGIIRYSYCDGMLVDV